MGARHAGIVGFKRTASATEVATPGFLLQCQDGNIEYEPIVAERDSVLSRDPAGSTGYGFKGTYQFSGVELPIEHLGRFLWMFLGGDVFVGGTHTITPADRPQYSCISFDRGFDLGSSTPTQVAVGAMIENLSIDVPMKGHAKASISGKFCSLAAEAAALTKTIPTGPNEAPISAKALKSAAGGYVKIGFNGSAPSADGELRGLKIELSQEIDDEGGVNFDSDQPSELLVGSRSVSWEVMKQLRGNAAAPYAAAKLQQAVGLDVLFTVGTNSARLLFPKASIRGSYLQGLDKSAASFEAKIAAKTDRDDAQSAVLTATIDDATSAAYT